MAVIQITWILLLSPARTLANRLYSFYEWDSGGAVRATCLLCRPETTSMSLSFLGFRLLLLSSEGSRVWTPELP